eukprot:gene2230-5240_t
MEDILKAAQTLDEITEKEQKLNRENGKCKKENEARKLLNHLQKEFADDLQSRQAS